MIAGSKKPARGGLTNHNDFLAGLMQRSADEIDQSQKAQDKIMEDYIVRTQKEKTEIDIHLLDDAPRDWNFFPALEPDKMLQLKMSIMSAGVLNPIIVWEKDNGRYMILAGHNRVQASREIIEEYKGSPLSRDYSKIPAIVYAKDEIDADKAQEIIIDTNYIQRGDMPPRLRVMVIRARVKLLRAQKDERGATIDQLIKDLGLKKTAIYEDIQLGTKIIEPLRELYFDGKISRRAVLKFAMFSEDLQDWIYTNFADKLTTARICQLRAGMKLREEIAAVFQDDAEDSAKIRTQITVPKEVLPDFRQVCTAYLADEEFKKLCDEYVRKRYPTEGN